MVGKARENAERAGLAAMLEDGRLTFTQCDARAVTPCADHGLVIANPPYGEQSNPKSASVAAMMKDVSDNLKHNFAGWTAWLLTSDRQLPRQMRLSESRKVPLYNGPLECRFFRFYRSTDGVSVLGIYARVLAASFRGRKLGSDCPPPHLVAAGDPCITPSARKIFRHRGIRAAPGTGAPATLLSFLRGRFCGTQLVD